MGATSFGRVDGREVVEVALRAASGAEARIISWGAVLRDLAVPGPNGLQRVVLGLDSLDAYVERSPYFGAIVGRYANRIGGARFRLDGREIRLVPNEGPNQLHGGPAGFGRRVWTVDAFDERSVSLSLVSDDGDMGWPGRLTARATYELLEPATLRLALEATADAPTPVNLTAHNYFNLDGSADVRDHRLRIPASRVTAVDAALIPTGESAEVAGTPYDFRTGRPIRPADPDFLYDINFALDGTGGDLALAATLASERSGLAMELWTTEPGLQVYDGHKLDPPMVGLGGARYGRFGGLALEPQRFPDGPNHPNFPPSLLRPGEVSLQRSEFRFRPLGRAD